jgi:hypothetical protein
MRTNVSALFHCDQWLAVDEADSQIERVLEATEISTGDQNASKSIGPPLAQMQPAGWSQQRYQPQHGQQQQQQPFSSQGQQQQQQQLQQQQLLHANSKIPQRK